jgi:hypothetical protein
MCNQLKSMVLLTTLTMTCITLFPINSTAADETKSIYKPLVKDAPNTRVGGGSRGSRGSRGVEGSTPVLGVLAPDHTGYTIYSQPTLYWSISKVIDKPIKLTMAYTDFTLGVEPIIETEIKMPQNTGMQAIDLAKVNWKTPDKGLIPEMEYQWSVSIIMDKQQSSNDIVASGTIERAPQARADKVANQIAKETDEKKQVVIYAENGMWYDAIEQLSKLIAQYPNDQKLQSQRAGLLQEVGLAN